MHLLEGPDRLGQGLELLLDGFVAFLQFAGLFLFALLEAFPRLLEKFVAAGFELVGSHGAEGLLQGFPILLNLLDLLLGGIAFGPGRGEFFACIAIGLLGSPQVTRCPGPGGCRAQPGGDHGHEKNLHCPAFFKLSIRARYSPGGKS